MRPELCCLLLAACPALAEPRFEPVTIPYHQYSGGWEHFVGGGLTVFDCDGDGLPEIFAAGGQSPALLLRNRTKPRGKLSFTDDTPDALKLAGLTGAYPLDINSDGFIDLALLRVGENILMRGGPDCSFDRFNNIGFLSGARWTTAFSATWETGQSLPTLAFGNYVNRDNPDGPFRACDKNMLYRPDGDMYGPPHSLEPGYCALSMLFSDWGRTGHADLRVSNDRHYYVDGGQEQLWAMEPAPRLFTQEDGWHDHKLWGMGIAARDIDRDGDTDVFLTSMGDQRLQLMVGNAVPTFKDAPYELGTTAQRPYRGGDGRPSTGWHVAFGDVQNDGRDDIFIVKGNVEQMPDSAWEDPNNLLIQNPDGTFTEQGGNAGLASLYRGRGGALVDFNADGLLDVAVLNRRAPMEIWQNVTPDPGNWLAITLIQPGPNPDAIGAWIELDDGKTLQKREVLVGGGHAGGLAGPEHFGLGDSQRVTVRVIWPDDQVSDGIEIDAGQSVTLRRQGAQYVVERQTHP